MKKFTFISLIIITFFSCHIALGAEITNQKTENDSESFSEMEFLAGDHKKQISREKMHTWTKNESFLKIELDAFPEIENIYYCPTNPAFCSLTITKSKSAHFSKNEELVVNREKIHDYLEELSKEINQEPEDAKFKMEEGKVVSFSPSRNGSRLDIEKSVEIIAKKISENTLPQSIELAYENIEPDVTTSEKNSLGIVALIGEGRSNFRGSTRSRIHNINVATSRFNGHLIKPGEEFSFVDILGPVDGEHGYKEELVIKKDKTEPEFGGGVCQVSTTTFRAAINSGLKITARRNHAYPVQYYNPQGMDATVYIPNPDLKFVNNTPGHILIQTRIEGTELIFEFYGTSDNRKVEVDGPKILQRSPDGSMKTTFTQRVFDDSGNILIEDIFNSDYDSPDKYPHPGSEQILTKKPKDWSDNEWKKYKKEHGI